MTMGSQENRQSPAWSGKGRLPRKDDLGAKIQQFCFVKIFRSVRKVLTNGVFGTRLSKRPYSDSSQHPTHPMLLVLVL